MPIDIRGKKTAEQTIDGQKYPGQNFEIDLDFNRGISARIEVGSLRAQKVRRLEVQCAKGVLILDPLSNPVLTLDGRPIAVSDELPMDRMLKHFKSLILKGGNPESSLDLGFKVVKGIESAMSEFPASRPV